MLLVAQPRTESRRQKRLVLAAVGVLGLSCVVIQLALMRELLGAFAGNEMTLGLVLGLWLLLMGMGTWLGRIADRTTFRPGALGWPLLLVGILPVIQVLLLRGLRDFIFGRGTAAGPFETVAGITGLLLPCCVAAGFALTLACSSLDRERGAAGLGAVYLADSVGSILGGILFSFILVRSFDHCRILSFAALLDLLTALAIGVICHRKWLAATSAALAVTVATAAVVFDWDALSTAWQYPQQTIVDRAVSPYGRVVVTEADGQFDWFENGVPILTTRDDQRVEEAVHYAMAQRPDARVVLLVGGGVSGTAQEVLKYGVDRVDYVELDPKLLELGRKYASEHLADRRIRTINTDGRLFVRRAVGRYDIVIIDMPDPSTAQLNRYYTAEFLAEVKGLLTASGVCAFSLGHYENYASPELARMLSSARASLAGSVRNLLIIPGGRVCFLGSDGVLFGDVASRLEHSGITNRLVNRNYLAATMTPDRMAQVAEAAAQPAAINRDFSPVLYFYHLRHWMSQFTAGFGVLQVVLLGALAAYLITLRSPSVALFASGFAGSALLMVLLLAFQVLCGSVYREVSLLVTVYMFGLALGAWVASRLFPGSREPALAGLALALAVCAGVFPVVLPAVARISPSSASLLWTKSAIWALTLVPAVLAGLQFPLAGRLAFKRAAAAASSLYTADFIGAFLGSLLASTLLIPLWGVAGACAVTAVLNLLAAGLVRFGKTAT